MSYPGLENMLRRVITGDDSDGKSVIIVDGPPSGASVEAGLGGLMEIWAEGLGDSLDPALREDKGPAAAILPPDDSQIKVRWYVIEPMPTGVPADRLRALARAGFARIGADHHMIDQSRHPGMHETDTVDVICLLKGRAKLVLENAETELVPGNVVIQRGTNHAWTAIDGTALFLAVLIDRKRG
jgi:hypothetical protein